MYEFPQRAALLHISRSDFFSLQIQHLKLPTSRKTFWLVSPRLHKQKKIQLTTVLFFSDVLDLRLKMFSFLFLFSSSSIVTIQLTTNR